ncbi:MAG: hypothetical protein RI566_12325 [Sediminimonas sp.]|nr:hypothetical protein [Sediminimonas sp.]
MKHGDVHATLTDARMIEALEDTPPRIDLYEGVQIFVGWRRGWNRL